MTVFFRIILPILLLALMPVRQVLAASAEPVSDVRVLIDVSGSMKQNDPNNLRAPALRMLVGLMPDDAKSGVWTFARFVNMLVPWREVNDNWRDEAEKDSQQIHSYGLFTNIEQALKKSTANIKQADPNYRRSLILLSDGFVDIEPDAEASQKSRQRIIDELVPRLKQANITVHTIALSEHADHELLRALSFATDGWYQQADTADDLQRIFLHLFEKSVQRDNVPLQENKFSIDDSVSEMTVLAFRTAGSEAARLFLPDGTTLSQDDQSASVRWLHENSFDLITIDNPIPGSWQIDAELDPDNRVMVVTDMQMQATDLPNNLLIGEQLDFEASLTEKGELITRTAFLDLVDASLQRQLEDNPPLQQTLRRDEQGAVYRTSLGQGFKAGRNDIVVTMKSATFERQRRQSINVIATPFVINTEQLPQQMRSHRITLQADTKLIKPESLTITALLKTDDGREWPYDMLKTADNNWQLTLTDLEPVQTYQLSLQIRGETLKGRQVFLQPESLLLTDSLPPVEPEPVEETMPVQPDEADQLQQEAAEVFEQSQVEEIVNAEHDAAVDVEDNQVSDETEAGLSDLTLLLIGNGIIVLLLVAGVIWWRRQSAGLTEAGELI